MPPPPSPRTAASPGSCVRVRIVADAAYHQTWEVVHQPSRLHLHTNDSHLRFQPLSFHTVHDTLVRRPDSTIVDHRLIVRTGASLHQSGFVTFLTIIPRFRAVPGFMQLCLRHPVAGHMALIFGYRSSASCISLCIWLPSRSRRALSDSMWLLSTPSGLFSDPVRLNPGPAVSSPRSNCTTPLRVSRGSPTTTSPRRISFRFLDQVYRLPLRPEVQTGHWGSESEVVLPLSLHCYCLCWTSSPPQRFVLPFFPVCMHSDRDSWAERGALRQIWPVTGVSSTSIGQIHATV